MSSTKLRDRKFYNNFYWKLPEEMSREIMRYLDPIQNRWEKKDKKFLEELQNATGTKRNDVTKHLTHTTEWGPNQYVRRREVIDKAKKDIENHSIVIFSGLGGSGKTALANKIMVEYDQKIWSKDGDFKPNRF